MAGLTTLTDDFQDGVIDASRWTTSGTLSETGGRAVITPTTSSSILSSLVWTYTLISSQVVVDVPVVPANGTTGTLQCGVVVDNGSNEYIAIRKVGSQLVCTKRVAGVESNLSFTPYNATNHRFWRLRENAGSVYFETSTNGTSGYFIQTVVSTGSVGFSLAVVGCYFYATYSGFELSPGTFQLESVNPGLPITASGASTSTGTAALLRIYSLTGSATSTSSGTAAITIPPLTFHSLTGAGASTSSGTASFIILAPAQVTAAGQSISSGRALFQLTNNITAVGQSFSNGTAEFTVVAVPTNPVITQYFYFEPPVVLDLPPTLPHPCPRYQNAHAKWKGGQRRGRTVLRTGSVCTVVDTPTVDQTKSADAVYMGGHIHVIPNTEADILSAAGLTVTPIPLVFTLFPALNVFPQTDTFPGFQDFQLP